MRVRLSIPFQLQTKDVFWNVKVDTLPFLFKLVHLKFFIGFVYMFWVKIKEKFVKWGRCLGCQMVWQTEHHRWHNSASNNCQLLYLWAIEPCYLTISGLWSFKLWNLTSKHFLLFWITMIFWFTFKYFQICAWPWLKASYNWS